jgi:uncharacterized metal-binding protein
MSETAKAANGARLVFACSGAADVGEIADRVARMLNRDGAARMHCLGCIGAKIDESVASVRAADRVLVIDGCAQDCARKCLQLAGLQNLRHLRLTDHQMEKGKTPPNVHNISLAADRARHVLLVP